MADEISYTGQGLFPIPRNVKFPVLFSCALNIKFPVLFSCALNIKFPVLFNCALNIKFPVLFSCALNIEFPVLFSWYLKHCLHASHSISYCSYRSGNTTYLKNKFDQLLKSVALQCTCIHI